MLPVAVVLPFPKRQANSFRYTTNEWATPLTWHSLPFARHHQAATVRRAYVRFFPITYDNVRTVRVRHFAVLWIDLNFVTKNKLITKNFLVWSPDYLIALYLERSLCIFVFESVIYRLCAVWSACIFTAVVHYVLSCLWYYVLICISQRTQLVWISMCALL